MREKTLRLKTSFRIVIIILLLNLGITNLCAEHVEPNVARNVASTFLRNNGAKSDQLTDVSAKAGFPNLYIFNGDNGFVIVAADDSFNPILGYSLTDSLNIDDMPDALQWWLNGYNDDIQYVMDNNIDLSSDVSAMWHNLKSGKSGMGQTTIVVGELLETRWHQLSPYNLMCPENTVTGCVATAMAQIMKKWNYPVQGQGTHTNTHNTNQTVNFGQTTYDWNHMTNIYNSSSTEEQKQAVATLMLHCGVSVDMTYGSNESIAYMDDAADALKEYFGYSDEAVYQQRNAIGDYDTWISWMKSDLNEGWPFLYGGDEVGGGGHCFVCDGYDSDNRFHFNFGWENTSSNGYFLINEIAYSQTQDAVFWIHPASSCSAPTNLSASLSGRTVTLSWTAAEGVSSYRVYRNDVLIASSATGTSYTDSNLEIGDYEYYLRSNCADGSLSDMSNIINVTVPFQGNVTANIGDLRYLLNEQLLEAQVIGYGEGISATGSLVIPASVTYTNDYEQIHNYSVTSIRYKAFYKCSGITSVEIGNSVTTIGDYAFYECSGITSIEIGNSVTTIGDYAFYRCSGLTSITIGNFVTTIGDYAFFRCSGLTGSLTIPNSVTTIGNCAFSECNGLTGSLTIPNSVTTIGDYAFSKCNGLTGSLTIPNSVSIIKEGSFRGCTGLNSLTIPNSVTTIGYWAFSGCSGLASVAIGNSVTTIEEGAFGSCTGLTSLTIPNSVISIGPYAFSGCDGLTGSLMIPNSVTTIGHYAFWGCSGLISVTIGNSVTTIGEGVFSSCIGLISITIPDSVITIGYYAFWGCSGLISVTIGNSVTTIENKAFYGCSGLTTVYWNAVNAYNGTSSPFGSCTNLTTVVFGNTVETIPNYAFAGCSGLTSVTIGNSVTTIGYAFSGCSGLTTVYWNAVNANSSPFGSCTNLTTVVFGNTVETIPNYAFSGCSGLTSVTIGNSVTTIGIRAFYGCSGLISLTIGNSVTTIESDAFYGCSGLTGSLTIPNSVTTIRSEAFYGCSGLTSVTIGNSVTTIVGAFRECSGLTTVYWNAVNANNGSSSPFGSCTNLTTVVFGNTVETIPNYAFSGRSGLTSVTIGNSVTTIGIRAFYGCSGLISLTIGNSVTTIEDNAFYGCSGLTSLTIPNSVTSIGSSAFYGCSGITGSLTIPNSITTIGESAFRNCSSLISLIIPNSVNTIPRYSFYGCSGLTSLTIPNSVTTIEENAFERCTGLTIVYWNAVNANISSFFSHPFQSPFDSCTNLATVVFGNSVETIPDYAFRRCSGLTTVYWNAVNANYSSSSNHPFDSCTNLATVVFGNSVETIPNYAFYGCSGLTSLTIPNSVTTIGEKAFYGCSGLTSLTIPNFVTTIGENAFYGCSGLTSLTIPNSVTSIGNSAFRGCSGLTTVTIPNSVTSIGSGAFYRCSGLTTVYWNAVNANNGSSSPFDLCTNLATVVFGNSVETIPNSAFSGCSGLTTVTIPNSVTTIGNYAFSGCDGITKINYIGSIIQWCNIDFYNTYSNPCYYGHNLYINNELLTDLIIPESITEIKTNSFVGCSSITDLTIPNSVTTIGYSAFRGCSGLTSLTIPNSVTSIGSGAFYGCSGLTGSLTIPNSVTTIGSEAFRGCSGLASITIGNSVTTIGNSAFYGCSGLTSVTIGNSVTTIDGVAFSGCSGLTSICLPNSLTSIGYRAFEGCSGLTSIVIPSSVTEIKNSVFDQCTNLNAIRVQWLNPITIYQYTFYGVDRDTPIFVPCGTQNDYKSAQYWSEFKNINESPQNMMLAKNDDLGGEIMVLKWADCEDNQCIILAEPNIGYNFTGWYVDDELLTMEPLYDFNHVNEIAFEARFERNASHNIANGTSNIWSNSNTWDSGEVPSTTSTVAIMKNITVDIDATVEALGVYDNSVLTIQSGVTLTVNDTLGSINESSIIIEDGGQLVHSSKEALATLKKSIDPYTSDDDGWSLISFPLTGNGAIVSVENMLSNLYDLYYYDEPSFTWINHKDDNNNFTELEAGKGYLYANLGTGVGAQGAKIGNGSSKTTYSPFYTYYNYSIAENLFLASELEAANLPTTVLSALCWYATNESGYQQNNLSIWMANVDDSELTSTSHNVSDMTLVYTGSMTPEIGWNEFVFNENSFTWDGTSNILVCVQRNNGAYNSTIYWQSHNPGFAAVSYKYNDNNAYDMASETYSMTTSSTIRPNTIFQTVEQIGQFESYESITMSFAGEIENGTAEVTVPLSYTGGNSLSGFNLVGNPFVHNVTSYETTNVADGCFRVNDAKTNLIVSTISELNPLKPAEGFFVKATGDNASVTFNSPTRKAEDNRGLIRLEIVESGKIVDRLIVKKDGEPLKKISLQGSHTELYARNNENNRLSIVPLEGDEQPVNFKAARMGSYTITAYIDKLEFDYLHLIDNLTGKNIDLLLDKEYTFYASTDDNESRFRLIFNPNALADDDEIFAYQYGDDIIVNGKGTLQVFDVLGRFVANYQINGDDRVSKPSPGVYILRMIGDNMKTQKIIVK